MGFSIFSVHSSLSRSPSYGPPPVPPATLVSFDDKGRDTHSSTPCRRGRVPTPTLSSADEVGAPEGPRDAKVPPWG